MSSTGSNSGGGSSEQKLLLIGPGKGGKTCMKSVIFENYLPRDVSRLKLSVGIDANKIRILNNLQLNLWDCGGQKDYVVTYLTKQKDFIFRNVYRMLFVFDVLGLSVNTGPAEQRSPAEEKQTQDLLSFAVSLAHGGSGSDVKNDNQPEWSKPEMLEYFVSAMAYLREHSPQSRVTILLHKIDTISPEYRDTIVEKRKKEIIQRLIDSGFPESITSSIDFFVTSIWSESLYYAYSTIIRSLIPHRGILINELKKIQKACDAADVALYERHTLLTIAHVSVDSSGVVEVDGSASESRLATLADILKGFRMSCQQSGTIPHEMRFTLGSGGTALLSPFTPCTLVLVVSHDARANVELHQLNVEAVRRTFEGYLRSRDPVAIAMHDVL